MIKPHPVEVKSRAPSHPRDSHNHDITLNEFKIQQTINIPQKNAYIFYDFQQQKNEKDSTGIKAKNICRICLEMDEVQKMMTPCRCMRSKKYVHESCIIQWIVKQVYERKVKKADINIIKCELCQQLYKFKIQSRHKSSCQILLKSIREKGCQQTILWILIILLAISILSAVSVISFMKNTQSTLYIDNQIIKIIILAFTIILCVIEIIICTVFFNQNFVYLEILIQKVYNFYDPIQISQRSNSSSSEENYPVEYFIVAKK